MRYGLWMGEAATDRRRARAAGMVAGCERGNCPTTGMATRGRSFRSSRMCGRAVCERHALSAARCLASGIKNHGGEGGPITNCRTGSGARCEPEVLEHADAERARPVPDVPGHSTDSASRLMESTAIPDHRWRLDRHMRPPRATAGSGSVVPRGRNAPGSRSCGCGRIRAGARAA